MGATRVVLASVVPACAEQHDACLNRFGVCCFYWCMVRQAVSSHGVSSIGSVVPTHTEKEMCHVNESVCATMYALMCTYTYEQHAVNGHAVNGHVSSALQIPCVCCKRGWNVSTPLLDAISTISTSIVVGALVQHDVGVAPLAVCGVMVSLSTGCLAPLNRQSNQRPLPSNSNLLC